MGLGFRCLIHREGDAIVNKRLPTPAGVVAHRRCDITGHGTINVEGKHLPRTANVNTKDDSKNDSSTKTSGHPVNHNLETGAGCQIWKVFSATTHVRHIRG